MLGPAGGKSYCIFISVLPDRVDPCVCDEVPIEVWFEPSLYTVNEAAGTVTLTIRTNIGSGPPVGSVRFGTRDGTAIGKGPM